MTDDEAMDDPDLETGARVIAENAVDAFMRERDRPLGLKPRACYAPVISFCACLSMRQTKAIMCSPASVVA